MALQNTKFFAIASQALRCYPNGQTARGALGTGIIAYSCAELRNTNVPSPNKMPVALESPKNKSNARGITQLASSDTHCLHQGHLESTLLSIYHGIIRAAEYSSQYLILGFSIAATNPTWALHTAINGTVSMSIWLLVLRAKCVL